jgi:hypothetical protein
MVSGAKHLMAMPMFQVSVDYPDLAQHSLVSPLKKVAPSVYRTDGGKCVASPDEGYQGSPSLCLPNLRRLGRVLGGAFEAHLLCCYPNVLSQTLQRKIWDTNIIVRALPPGVSQTCDRVAWSGCSIAGIRG